MDIQELLSRESRTSIETWCRRNAQAVYVGNDTVLCRVLGKYPMYVQASDVSVGSRLMLDGYWEMWITMAIARYLKPGMTCLDVGAHVGYYTVLMADIVGARGRVITLEPYVPSYRHLCNNIVVNGVATVEVHSYAASDVTGMRNMYVDRTYTGNNTLENDYCSDGEAERLGLVEPIICSKIDDKVDVAVDFIKIDAERHERHVWRGMQQLLARNTNVQVAMEYTFAADPEHELLKEISESGYEIHDIQGDGTLRKMTAEQVVSDPSVQWRMLWLKR
jgi:FkbM family methyltransferase